MFESVCLHETTKRSAHAGVCSVEGKWFAELASLECARAHVLKGPTAQWHVGYEFNRTESHDTGGQGVPGGAGS